jgi:HD-GYP domain-containing protein (c-di-GMP phosphodiesterase class II)
MTSERPYRPALAPKDAADELRRQAGRQFHPDVVEALLRAV